MKALQHVVIFNHFKYNIYQKDTIQKVHVVITPPWNE